MQGGLAGPHASKWPLTQILMMMWMTRVMGFQVQGPDVDNDTMLATGSKAKVALHPKLLEEVVGPLDRMLPSRGVAR